MTTNPTASSTSSSEPVKGSWATKPLQRLLERLLSKAAIGTLDVTLPSGATVRGGGARSGPQATMRLHRWRALRRLVTRGDLGLAESYRDGDWSTADLTALLEFGALNQAQWGDVFSASWPVRLALRLHHQMHANTRRGSRQNIAAHYDLGNAFYQPWLDESMTYSSALFEAPRRHSWEVAAPKESLGEAQQRKIDRILELLDLPRAGRVLEIGCGWGSLAVAMAARADARVTGLTLSTEQLARARGLVRERGLQSQVDLVLRDYRDEQGRYDRIVSIEMLEAVGERYWPRYFQTLADRLDPASPGSRAVVQAITIAEPYFDEYRRNEDFIQRFIFPGGMLPTVDIMREQARAAGLTMTVAESFGLSYAATLSLWRQRFLAAWQDIEPLGFDERFKRLWEYYLCYCEAGFLTQRIDVGLYVFEPAT